MDTGELIRKAIRRGHWNLAPMLLFFIIHGIRMTFPVLSWQRELGSWLEWVVLAAWVARIVYVRRHPLVPGIKEATLTPRAFAMGWVAVAIVVLGGWFGARVGYF